MSYYLKPLCSAHVFVRAGPKEVVSPVPRYDRCLCSGLVVETSGLGRSHCGPWERFDLFRLCDIKQLLPPSRNLGRLFFDGLLGRSTTTHFYRCEQFLQEHGHTVHLSDFRIATPHKTRSLRTDAAGCVRPLLVDGMKSGPWEPR